MPVDFPQPPPTSPAHQDALLMAATLKACGWNVHDIRDDGTTTTIIASKPTKRNTQDATKLRDLEASLLGPLPKRNA